jgi:hypothetical protein
LPYRLLVAHASSLVAMLIKVCFFLKEPFAPHPNRGFVA